MTTPRRAPADPKDVEAALQTIEDTAAFCFANPDAPSHELAHALGVEIPHAIETIRAARGEREPTPSPDEREREEKNDE